MEDTALMDVNIFGDTMALIDGHYLQHQIDPNQHYGWCETLKLDFRAFHNWLFALVQGIEDGSYYFEGEPRIDAKLPPWEIPAAETWVKGRWSHLHAWKKAGFGLELGTMIWVTEHCNCRSADAAHRAICPSVRVPQQKEVDIRMAFRIRDTIQDRPWVRRFILIAGDGDHVPAVEYAHEWGREVILIHGTYDVSKKLHKLADRKYELSREWLLAAPFVSVVSRQMPLAAR